jgi:copper(I)-binding protein
MLAGGLRKSVPFVGKAFQRRIRDMKRMIVVCSIGVMPWSFASAANISVTNAWARATMPGQPVSAAYLEIRSDSDAKLVAAKSPVIPRVEVHEMSMAGGVMKMRQVKAIPLPKGETVKLEPGGYHIMLMNLKKPIAAGEKIPLTLIVEADGKRQEVKIEAEAKSREAAPDGMHGHDHH